MERPQSEKTEQPSRKRLRDARKKGQAATSKEFTQSVSFVCVVVVLWLLRDYYLDHANQLIAMMTNVPTNHDALAQRALNALVDVFVILIQLAAPIVGTAIAAGMLAGFVQARVFSFDPVTPKAENINPIQGFKRIFSLTNLVNLLLSLLKVGLLGAVLYFVILQSLPGFILAPYSDVPGIVTMGGQAFAYVCAWAAAIFLLLSAVDYGYRYYDFLRQNRMTKEEVKRELKETEGEPLLKALRRAWGREMVYRDPLAQVPHATLVVTDGVKQSVVLRYQEARDELPFLLLKGADIFGLRIQQVAQDANVPIVISPALVRKLFEQPEGQYVHRSLFSPVVQALREAGVM